MTGNYLRIEELGDLGLRACGRDVLISRDCSLYGVERISLGSHVRIDDGCLMSSGLEGYLTVGDYVHVSAHVALFGGGGISIGSFCTLSPKACVLSESDDFSGDHLVGPLMPERLRGCTRAEVALLDYSAIGTACVLLPGVTVGVGAAVGALSLVSRDLDSWGIYAGSPARRIGDRSEKLIALAESVRTSDAFDQDGGCDE